jgi:hypothetical protein
MRTVLQIKQHRHGPYGQSADISVLVFPRRFRERDQPTAGHRCSPRCWVGPSGHTVRHGAGLPLGLERVDARLEISVTKWLFRVLAPLCTLVVTTVAGAAPANAAWLKGGLDLDGYCKSTGYDRVALIGSTADDWRCVERGGFGRLVRINMPAACVAQHRTVLDGDIIIVDRPNDFYDPYSWQCWGTTRALGQPDIAGYCRSDGATANLAGSTAYDWECVYRDGHRRQLGRFMDIVCRATYRSADFPISRPDSFTGPNSWYCWN